jgi:hypothetical protein
MQHKAKTMPNKQIKNEHQYNTKRQKKSLCDQKMEHGLHFYTHSLSLTLNNAFASLGGGGYLGILKPKLSRVRFKFSERTCLIFQNKK